MKKITKIMTVLLSAVLLISTFIIPASAKGVFDGAAKMEALEYYSKAFSERGEYKIYKLSVNKPGTITIRANKTSELSVELYNSNAELLNSYGCSYNNGATTIEMKTEKAGTYYLKFRDTGSFGTVGYYEDLYYTFTPTDKPILSLALSMKKGSSLTLGYAVENYKGKVEWVSTKPSVATVSSKGKVTAKKKGTATIRVQLDSGDYAQIKIVVK